MLFVDDIPMNVSISQAVTLTLKFGEDKAKQFVNGVLSGVFKDVEENGVEAVIAEAAYDPEADPENTPDSVFCDHGAGFNVKWNKVSEYSDLFWQTAKKTPFYELLKSK